MHCRLLQEITPLFQLTAIIIGFFITFNSYAYDKCISINSVLVDKICYENLGDYRTDNDSKQGGSSSSQLPKDITDYGVYFYLVDPDKVQDIYITNTGYKFSYDHNLRGQTLYLQDNQRHDITFKFKGAEYGSVNPDSVCVFKNIWTISWVFLKHLWGFFNSGSWQAVWTEIQIEECNWKSTTKTYADEQHTVSIDVPINAAHATEAVSIELDNKHVGEQPRFRVSTTYPHAVEGTVTLSTTADKSSEHSDIHKERFVLSSENDHYLAPVSLDKDHLAENITTTAIVRVENDKQDINIHSDVINHHRRLQEIQLINSLDDMASNCQHSTLSVLRTQDNYCLLQSSALSEASNDFYNMFIQPEQQARYGKWDNTGDATVVKTKVAINFGEQDKHEDYPPPTHRYHVYDNGLATCKITDDLNQRDFPALSCHVDNYASHTLQIDYDHRQQAFNAYLVTAKGKKPLTDIELESLLHHNWQDWIVGNPLDTFARESYTLVPSNTADKQIFPAHHALSALFPDNNQYIPIGQARNATADIDLVASLLDGFNTAYLLHPNKESLDNLTVQSIYQMKRDRSIEWRDLDRFLTVSEEDEKALSTETLSLEEWRSQLVRQSGGCDKRWEDYINSARYKTRINDCLEDANGVYLALLKIAIADYYLRSSENIKLAQNVITRLNNKFNSLVIYLRLHYIQQAFQNQDAPIPDFLKTELAPYGEYNQQAHSALLNACLSNALCSQLIFNVQHYESLISNLSDRYHQRTNNLNQKLSPILSGNGLTEFLLALESWQVWDQYQRTLEQGDSQFMVTDNLDGSLRIKFMMPENTDDPLVLDIATQHPLHDFAKKFFEQALTQQERQLFTNSLSNLYAIDNFQKQLLDCGDNQQCVNTAFAEFEGTRPQPSVMDQLGQELDACNEYDDDCIQRALNDANSRIASYMPADQVRNINTLSQCVASHLESGEDYRTCVIDGAVALYPDIGHQEFTNSYDRMADFKQCIDDQPHPKTRQTIKDCINGQLPDQLKAGLIPFVDNLANLLEAKRQQYPDLFPSYVEDACQINEVADNRYNFKSILNFVIPSAYADEGEEDLCRAIEALQMNLRALLELVVLAQGNQFDDLRASLDAEDLNTLGVFLWHFNLVDDNEGGQTLQSRIEKFVEEKLNKLIQTYNRRDPFFISRVDDLNSAIVRYVHNQIATSNNSDEIHSALQKAMASKYRKYFYARTVAASTKDCPLGDNKCTRPAVAFLLVDGFDEAVTALFSELGFGGTRHHSAELATTAGLSAFVTVQAVIEIITTGSSGAFTPMALSAWLMFAAEVTDRGDWHTAGAVAYILAALAFNGDRLMDTGRAFIDNLKSICGRECPNSLNPLYGEFWRALPDRLSLTTYIWLMVGYSESIHHYQVNSQLSSTKIRSLMGNRYIGASYAVLPINILSRILNYCWGWDQQEQFNDSLRGVGSLNDVPNALWQLYREEQLPTSIWFSPARNATNPPDYSLQITYTNGNTEAFPLHTLVDYVEAYYLRERGREITINHPLRLEVDTSNRDREFRITDGYIVNIPMDGLRNYIQTIRPSLMVDFTSRHRPRIITDGSAVNPVSVEMSAEIIDSETHSSRVLHLPLARQVNHPEPSQNPNDRFLINDGDFNLIDNETDQTVKSGNEQEKRIEYGKKYLFSEKHRCQWFTEFFYHLLGRCLQIKNRAYDYVYGAPPEQLRPVQGQEGYRFFSLALDPSAYAEYRIVDGNIIQGRLEDSIEWDFITEIDPNFELDLPIPVAPQPLTQLGFRALIANMPSIIDNSSALRALIDNIVRTQPLERGHDDRVISLRNWLISENPPHEGAEYEYGMQRLDETVVLRRRLTGTGQIEEWELFNSGRQLVDFSRLGFRLGTYEVNKRRLIDNLIRNFNL